MKIKHNILLLVVACVALVTVIWSVLAYHNAKSILFEGIDGKLYVAANLVEHILPVGYHDQIVDKSSVSMEDYLGIVDTYNEHCVELELEYIWSLMKVDGTVVFTSGTSTSKDVANGDHALFFDVHSKPEAYEEVFRTMEPQYKDNVDKWGHIRAVLVPFYDAHGRPCLYGASMKVSEVEALAYRNMLDTVLTGLIVIALALILAALWARTLSKPIVQLTALAKQISKGELGKTMVPSGCAEINSLAESVNQMSGSLKVMVDDLEQKNVELEGFIYSLSHDLKTPVVTMTSLMGLIRSYQDKHEFEQAATYLDKAEQAGQNMQVLLNDVLELARVGRVEAPFTNLSIASVITQALEISTDRLANVSVEIEVSSPLPLVHADAISLDQVLGNLLDNCIQYASSERENKIIIGAELQDEQVLVSIEDNGIGIEEQYAERVFNLFEQLNPKRDGVGIGLTFARRIIENHQGSIWIEPATKLQGARCCFTLPQST